jgi:hypothetical protein
LVNSNNAKQLAAQHIALKSLSITGANMSRNTITTLGPRNPGLNLSTITGSNTITGLSITGNMNNAVTWDSNGNVKKYEVVETTEDILALSVTWHRLRLLGINTIERPTTLTDNILFTEINQEDRNRADTIRDYFSKKIVMITLRGQNLSSFRKDLNTFIHGDCKIVKEEMMPLIYRLPEFYDNDIRHDEMFRDFNKHFEDTSKLWRGTKTLKPVRKFFINLKTKKFLEYWLKDENDRGYRIEIPFENKLNHLWEHFFKQETIPILGAYRYSEHDGINYYQIKDWEIDFTKT